MQLKPRERIILSLDFDALVKAQRVIIPVRTIGIDTFKIGYQMALARGGIDESVFLAKEFFAGDQNEGKVLLDLKFHDIPNTVGRAMEKLTEMGIWAVTVHASAGFDVLKTVVNYSGNSLIFVVTVLTSMNPEACKQVYGRYPQQVVKDFSKLAQDAGAHGIICSARDLEVIKDIKLLKVTPGIRPKWALKNDQVMTMTPSEAISAGADYLIIGRPITNPPEAIGTPVEAAKLIINEIELATVGQ